ncbi:uncharacterized protein [Leptinotarsa decemlineata]|uniref:uncharacterized protein n=1 Tax=Leptinotarsa decemlineata TaxID=7539 RepID=UPI003D306443
MLLQILQINTDRRRNAHYLMQRMAEELNVDVVVIQEPNRAIVRKDSKFNTDPGEDTAIWCRNRRCGVVGHKSEHGFTCIAFDTWNLYNCYVSPNIVLGNFKEYIDRLAQHIRNGRKDVVVSGDLNAKSTMWNSDSTDRRGEYVEEWISEVNMTVHNTGRVPTFSRAEQSSIIDITLSTGELSTRISDWHVSQVERGSLHNYVLYRVETERKATKIVRHQEIYVDARAFRDAFELLSHNIVGMTELIASTKCAQKMSQRFGEDGTSRQQPAWWSEAIQDLRTACNRCRRELTRARRARLEPVDIAAKEAVYKEARRSLRKQISKAQKEGWKELCDRLEDDPWGQLKGYQTPYDLDQSRKLTLLRDLFPEMDTEQQEAHEVVHGAASPLLPRKSWKWQKVD